MSVKTSCFKISLSLIAALLILSPGCSPKPEATRWVGTWASSQQLVEPHNMPPEPGLTNNTLRQIVRTSIGGDSLRLKLSNLFSDDSVELNEVMIALSSGSHTTDSTTNTPLSFGGERTISIAAGEEIISDPVAFKLEPLSELAITISFGNTPDNITGHPGSRTTSYLTTNNSVKDAGFDNFVETDHWYLINAIDVKAPETAAAIVTLGNSITDGRGSGTNKQNRWPDILAQRLANNEATANISVLNHGVGGNCVLKPCLGESALDRFQRDVIDQQGVKWLIILIGVNDIGQTPDSTAAMTVADDLIAAFSSMIEDAHAAGIKVYGCTILPFGESFYYAPFREEARLKVNDWIRNSKSFDAVIDFDLATQTPEFPRIMQVGIHTGDYLHPNEKGYKLMGEYIDLKLFSEL